MRFIDPITIPIRSLPSELWRLANACLKFNCITRLSHFDWKCNIWMQLQTENVPAQKSRSILHILSQREHNSQALNAVSIPLMSIHHRRMRRLSHSSPKPHGITALNLRNYTTECLWLWFQRSFGVEIGCVPCRFIGQSISASEMIHFQMLWKRNPIFDETQSTLPSDQLSNFFAYWSHFKFFRGNIESSSRIRNCHCKMRSFSPWAAKDFEVSRHGWEKRDEKCRFIDEKWGRYVWMTTQWAQRK